MAILQEQYANALNGRYLTGAGTNAIGININFDGTQNNREYVVNDGESMTNVGQIASLQESARDPRNTIYMSGIGAQTVPSGTGASARRMPQTTRTLRAPLLQALACSFQRTPWLDIAKADGG